MSEQWEVLKVEVPLVVPNRLRRPIFPRAMGQSSSEPLDLPALPQQHIVNVRADGQADFSQHPPQIGTVQQTVAVKPSMSLLRGALRLAEGKVSLDIVATTSGHVELLLCAKESPQSAAWPRMLAPAGPRLSISASKETQSIKFDCPMSLRALQEANKSDKGVTTWPAVLVLRPGPPVSGGTLAEDPPDGTMLAFCASAVVELQICKFVC
eukprot:Skav201859  [mRNA]  locus=scaffold3490:73671:79089:- [translate_table: standard]